IHVRDCADYWDGVRSSLSCPTFTPEGSSAHWRPCTAAAGGRRRDPAEDAAQLRAPFGCRRRCGTGSAVATQRSNPAPVSVVGFGGDDKRLGSARLGSALQQQQEAFLNNQSQGKIQTSWPLSGGAGSTFTQQPEPDWEPELQRELQEHQVWMDLRENMGFWSVTQPHNLCPDTGGTGSPHAGTHLKNQEYVQEDHKCGPLGMLGATSAASWRGAGMTAAPPD
ncbi:hypothetical protein D4764_04G0001680, partial [Takifugu flavidus]